MLSFSFFFFVFCQESLQAAVNDWNRAQAAVNHPRGVCVSAELVYLHLKEIWDRCKHFDGIYGRDKGRLTF